MIADELRRQADNFLDLKALQREFGRELPDRDQEDDDYDDD